MTNGLEAIGGFLNTINTNIIDKADFNKYNQKSIFGRVGKSE